ncbi:MAG: bis(5'-nucleosyl)-tetraphosphatase (symmetrical) YqeK [Candidatus Atribacteria bacterium]|nr:bis(5'-nucleosyl)-tetraphosphatase (symmetrical) YqeK [Candidatus Atribacteria bacterium]
MNLKLKNMLTEERYQHSCMVSKVAEEIARYYHVSTEKAKVLGLIHDCAKDLTHHDLQDLVKKYHIRLTEIEKCIPGIWHAYVGAYLARDIFEIDDPEMLQAIKYHSTGSDSLNLLGKIIYIADKIEPGREINSNGKIRELVWQDIDQAMLELLNSELKYLVSKNEIIHPDTLQCRNEILYKNKFRRNDEKSRKTESFKKEE